MEANWFLSACAQTSGAIVAVIGGFLVSRLVSLSAERSGQRSRLREIARSLADVKLDEITSRSELDSFLKRKFEEVSLEECTAALGRSLGFESVYQQHRDVCGDLAIDACRAIFRQVQNDVAAAFKFLAGRVPDDCTLVLTELVEEEVLDRSGISIDALEEVFSHLVRERSSVPFFGNVVESTAKAQIDLQQKLTSEGRWRARASEARQLQGVEREIEARLARLGRPDGFGMLFCSLCYLTFFGILVPLALLLVRGGHHSTTIVALVLSLFAVGVMLVLASLVRERRKLNSTDFLQEHYANMREWQEEQGIPWE